MPKCYHSVRKVTLCVHQAYLTGTDIVHCHMCRVDENHVLVLLFAVHFLQYFRGRAQVQVAADYCSCPVMYLTATLVIIVHLISPEHAYVLPLTGSSHNDTV